MNIKENRFHPFTYILLTSLIWVIIIYMLFYYARKIDNRYYNKINELRSSKKLLQDYIIFQEYLTMLKFNNALYKLYRISMPLAKLSEKERIRILKYSIKEIFYLAGRADCKPSVPHGISLKLSDEIVLEALNESLFADMPTSRTINYKNIVSLFDIFSEKKFHYEAFNIIHQYYMYKFKDLEKADEIIKYLASLGANEQNILPDDLKGMVFMETKNYKGTIELRMKTIPEIKQNLPVMQQALLMDEVFAYIKLGEIEKACKIGREYLDKNIVTFPEGRKIIKYLVEKHEKKK